MIDRARLAALLHTTLPGWTLAVALVFAPWCWGCTRPIGIELLTILLFAAMAAWCVGVLIRGEKLHLPPLLTGAVLLLLAQGWWMAFNAESVCDSDGLLVPRAGHLAWLPGSVDAPSSLDAMLRLSGLLGTGVIAAWVGPIRAWRRRFAVALVGTGVSIVLLGCWQRWSRADDIFWATDRHLDFFFATYRNVTNAGEYLNLVFPVAAALTLLGVVKGLGPWRVAFGATAVAIVITGSFVSGSKMAPLFTGFSAALFLLLQHRDWRPRAARINLRSRLLMLIIVFTAVAAIVQSVGLGIAWDRWSRLFGDKGGDNTWSHRLMVDQVCAIAAPDAGVLGFGAGTFHAIFPYYSARVDGDLTGYWIYAHDDYAQTALEWGALGSAAWSAYFFGGIVMLVRAWRRLGWRTEERIAAACLLQALIVLAAMAPVDFPLQIASLQLIAAILIGLAWSSTRWKRAAPLPRSGREAGAPPNRDNFDTRISLRGQALELPSCLVR